MADAINHFESISIGHLEESQAAHLDILPFGVIGMRPDTVTDIYNATEARLAGLTAERVLGVPFFEAVGQCMNNFMVAQRFDDEPELDEIVPYVLTLKMRPTPVRLRLLKAPQIQRRYVLIER